jgi:RNA recognition motif-containing protein
MYLFPLNSLNFYIVLRVMLFLVLKLQIRETPHKRHHKFIEFYDVRAADAALKALNRSDIAGKRIKLEPSRPGGARRK